MIVRPRTTGFRRVRTPPSGRRTRTVTGIADPGSASIRTTSTSVLRRLVSVARPATPSGGAATVSRSSRRGSGSEPGGGVGSSVATSTAPGAMREGSRSRPLNRPSGPAVSRAVARRRPRGVVATARMVAGRLATPVRATHPVWRLARHRPVAVADTVRAGGAAGVGAWTITRSRYLGRPRTGWAVVAPAGRAGIHSPA